MLAFREIYVSFKKKKKTRKFCNDKSDIIPFVCMVAAYIK